MAEDKEEELMEIAKCEVCGKGSGTENINIGIDVGYHIGDYAEKKPKFFKVKPECIAVTSIYLCKNCKNNIQDRLFTGRFGLAILPRIKEQIKSYWVKEKILETLENENRQN